MWDSRRDREEFAETVEFLKRIHLFETHIFKYSRRKGTRAAVMEHQVPEQIKTERSHVLLAWMQRIPDSIWRNSVVSRWRF